MRLFDGARDLSGGRWRRTLYTTRRDWPAAQPQHERRKYLRDGVLWKFAGFGGYGRETLDLARCLNPAGFGPQVPASRKRLSGHPLDTRPPLRREMADPRPIETVPRYLAFLASEFPRENAGPAWAR